MLADGALTGALSPAASTADIDAAALFTFLSRYVYIFSHNDFSWACTCTKLIFTALHFSLHSRSFLADFECWNSLRAAQQLCYLTLNSTRLSRNDWDTATRLVDERNMNDSPMWKNICALCGRRKATFKRARGLWCARREERRWKRNWKQKPTSNLELSRRVDMARWTWEKGVKESFANCAAKNKQFIIRWNFAYMSQILITVTNCACVDVVIVLGFSRFRPCQRENFVHREICKSFCRLFFCSSML